MQVYNQTDRRLHWLCQPIAKAGRSFAPPQDDDSHMNLYFDALGERLSGRWIPLDKERVLLTLKLHTLEFEWVNDDFQVMASCTSVGKTMAELEDTLAAHAQTLGLNTEGFKAPLNYEMPVYPFAQDAIQTIEQDALQHWMHYRKLANDACTWVLGYWQILGDIRIWPHHFDTGIFVYPTDQMGVGFGWAMQDQMCAEPYFYMAGYPKRGTIDYREVPDLTKGVWCIHDEWSGATLPCSTLEAAEDKGQTKDQVISEFLRTPLKWYLQTPL